MSRVLSEINVKHARKDYPCDACHFLLEAFGSFSHVIKENPQLTMKERVILSEVFDKNYKIKKGEPYYKQVGEADGDFYVFKANMDILKICYKLNIFDE